MIFVFYASATHAVNRPAEALCFRSVRPFVRAYKGGDIQRLTFG